MNKGCSLQLADDHPSLRCDCGLDLECARLRQRIQDLCEDFNQCHSERADLAHSNSELRAGLQESEKQKRELVEMLKRVLRNDLAAITSNAWKLLERHGEAHD